MALKLLCSLMQTKHSIIESARRIMIITTSQTKDSTLTAQSMAPSQHTHKTVASVISCPSATPNLEQTSQKHT
jgi:hypothetical protein